MNCTECKEKLIELLEDLLPESQRQTVEEHLKDCQICQAELQKLKELSERLISDSKTWQQTSLEDAVFNRIIREQSQKLKQSNKISHKFRIWRKIMNSKITKFAAAAVIIIAIMIGINQFGGSIDGASVAWASLAERVGNIQTCLFKGHMEITGGPQGQKVQKMEMEMCSSSQYGFRSEMSMGENGETMTQYMIPAEKVMISVMPSQKQYMRMLLTDEMMEKRRLQGNDPREMVKQIMLGEYTHLGESVIDGVKVEGIETTDPRVGGGQFEKYLARCWVNVETQLPVQLEMQAEYSVGPDTPPMKVSMILDNFQWAVVLNPEIFQPDIPSDYKLMAEMQMPGQDEEAAIKGLEVFAEIASGKYPQKLTVMNIMEEISEIEKNSGQQWQSQRDADPNFAPTEEQIDEARNKVMKKMAVVQGACMFYAELVKTDKDAAYYGDKVTAGDADAVLMRWKISENQYRVIYGDLTAENVSSEQLAQLEAALSK
jgi:hypothetical protein